MDKSYQNATLFAKSCQGCLEPRFLENRISIAEHAAREPHLLVVSGWLSGWGCSDGWDAVDGVAGRIFNIR